MPKKQRKKKQNFTKIYMPIVNILILLGYIVMYPFEKGYVLTKQIKVKSLIERFSQVRAPKIKVPKLTLPKIHFPKVKLPTFTTKKAKKAKKGKKEKKVAPKVKTTRSTIWTSIKAFTFGILFTLFFIVTPLYVYAWYKQLPQPNLLEITSDNKTTKILDRKGRTLYEIYVDKKYDPVDLERVPDHVILATLAVEDSEFYKHFGFNPVSMLRAAKATLLEDDLQGASTITQQLVKNVLLTSERTLSRKTKEVVLAVLVEQKYTKNEILELYLNNIPYGGTAYGIQAAAQKYFNKNVWDLDLAEATLLAGLPSAPSVYSPVQGGEELAKVRQKHVLDRMVELGYITKREADEAYAQELTFAPQVEYIRAPHFVEYVRQELYKKYGQRAVDFGGLTVNTTLDLDLQEEVQKIIAEEVAKAGYMNLSNGAAVVLDPRSGAILAHVGSKGYFLEDYDGKFDVVTAQRQPGSSIKPITYSLAFENGYSASSLITDSPVTYQIGGQTYTPRNYDGKFHGTLTLRRALASSFNIPPVKLINLLGVDNMVELATKLGITTWTVGDGSYGMSITLGGKEVRLLDLANVYATFARMGVHKETTPFISIKDAYGFEIYNFESNKGEQVIKPSTAYIITNILSDNNARAGVFGVNNKMYIPGHTVAAKTGTTNDSRDGLTVGYTPSYVVAVWVGNNDNSPMIGAGGISGAGPIWNRIMHHLLDDTADEPFVAPDDIVVRVDSSCGVSDVFDKDVEVKGSLCPPKKENKNADNDRDN